MSSVYSENEEFPPHDSASYYYPSYDAYPQDSPWPAPSTSQRYWEEGAAPPLCDAAPSAEEFSYATGDVSYPSWDYSSYGQYSDDSYNEHYDTYYPQYGYPQEDVEASEATIPCDTLTQAMPCDTCTATEEGEEPPPAPQTPNDDAPVAHTAAPEDADPEPRDEDGASDVSTSPRPASGDAASVSGGGAVQQVEDIAVSSVEDCVSVETAASSSAPSEGGARTESVEPEEESRSLDPQRRPTSLPPDGAEAVALPPPPPLPSRRWARSERPRGRCEDRRRRPLLSRGTRSGRRAKATSLAEAAALAAVAVSQHTGWSSGSSGSEGSSPSPLRCSSVQQPPSRLTALQSPGEEMRKGPLPSPPSWAEAQTEDEGEEEEERAGRAVARCTVRAAAQAAARAAQGDGDAARWRRAASWLVRCAAFSTSESEMERDDDDEGEGSTQKELDNADGRSPPLSPGAARRVLAAPSHEERLQRALAESQKARGLTPWTWEALVGPEPRPLGANCSAVPAPSVEERRRFRRALFAGAPPRGWKAVATQVKRQVRQASERSLARLQVDSKTKAPPSSAPPPPQAQRAHHVLGEPTLLDEVCQEVVSTREVALQTGDGDKELAKRKSASTLLALTAERDSKLPISVKLSPRYIFRPIEELKSALTEDESESDANLHADAARGERPRLVRKGSAAAQQIAKESLGYTPLMNADLTQTIRRLNEEAREMRSLSPVSWTSSASGEEQGVGESGGGGKKRGSGRAATARPKKPQGLKNPVPMATALRAAARRQAAIDKSKKQADAAEEPAAIAATSTPPEKESIPVTPAVKEEKSAAGDAAGAPTVDSSRDAKGDDDKRATNRTSSSGGAASLLRLPPIAAGRRAPLTSLRRVRSIFECELSSPRRGRASPPCAPPSSAATPPAPPTPPQRLQPLALAPRECRASAWRGKGVGASAPLPAIGAGGGRRNNPHAPTGAGDGTAARAPNKRLILRPPFR